jgi:hypothetical protein
MKYSKKGGILMANGIVKVYGDIPGETFHGEKDGYGYNFLESSETGHMMYEVSNPDNSHKLVEVDSDGAAHLRDNPKEFWDTYIDKK